MIIKIYFYKADVDGKFLDNGIAFHTSVVNLPYMFTNKIPFKAYRKLKCSHIEIRFNDAMWTSTMGVAGGKSRSGGGVCCRPASDILKHPERWFYTEIEITTEQAETLLMFMHTLLANNQGYDKSLIGRYFLPTYLVELFNLDSSNKYICSEFVGDCLRRIGKGVKDDNPSPFRIALGLYLQGYKFYNADGSLLCEK